MTCNLYRKLQAEASALELFDILAPAALQKCECTAVGNLHISLSITTYRQLMPSGLQCAVSFRKPHRRLSGESSFASSTQHPFMVRMAACPARLCQTCRCTETDVAADLAACWKRALQPEIHGPAKVGVSSSTSATRQCGRPLVKLMKCSMVHPLAGSIGLHGY